MDLVAETHLLGSREGYRTIARSPGIAADEERELGVLGFGQISERAGLEALWSRPSAFGRRLASGRFAVTRILPGEADDAGRPTLELRTLVLSPKAYLAICRGGLEHLVDGEAVWRDAAFRRGQALPLPVPPPPAAAATAAHAWIADAWFTIARSGDRVVRLEDSPRTRAEILQVATFMHPHDLARYRWGIGLLSTSVPVDLLSIAPHGSEAGRRLVHRLDHSASDTRLRPAAAELVGRRVWPSLSPSPAATTAGGRGDWAVPPPPRRRRTLAVAAAVLLGVLCVVIAILVLQRPAPSESRFAATPSREMPRRPAPGIPPPPPVSPDPSPEASRQAVDPPGMVAMAQGSASAAGDVQPVAPSEAAESPGESPSEPPLPMPSGGGTASGGAAGPPAPSLPTVGQASDIPEPSPPPRRSDPSSRPAEPTPAMPPPSPPPTCECDGIQQELEALWSTTSGRDPNRPSKADEAWTSLLGKIATAAASLDDVRAARREKRPIDASFRAGLVGDLCTIDWAADWSRAMSTRFVKHFKEASSLGDRDGSLQEIIKFFKGGRVDGAASGELPAKFIFTIRTPTASFVPSQGRTRTPAALGIPPKQSMEPIDEPDRRRFVNISKTERQQLVEALQSTGDGADADLADCILKALPRDRPGSERDRNRQAQPAGTAEDPETDGVAADPSGNDAATTDPPDDPESKPLPDRHASIPPPPSPLGEGTLRGSGSLA